MINSKRQLYLALKAKKPLTFITIYNDITPNLIGEKRKAGAFNKSFFIIETPIGDQLFDLKVYFTNITVKNNIIKYKNYDVKYKIQEE